MLRGASSRKNRLTSRWVLLCTLLCATWCRTSYAQTHTLQSVSSEELLAQAKTALERARFDDAEKLLAELTARPLLSAREHNEALEMSAIVAIAERRETRARDTLRTLLRRDPAHPRRVSDPGPGVDAAFARAQQARETAMEVPLQLRLDRDPGQRPRLHVAVGEGRDAVETVHVFVDTLDGGPITHLVRPALGDEELIFLLPSPLVGGNALNLYLEAQAPSGTVIGRLGGATTPLLTPIPALPVVKPTCTMGVKPLRKEWWVWTTVGLVVGGVIVASAVTVQ